MRRWPTVFVALTLPVLLGLGIWQLERREWKTALLEHVADGMSAPPVVLPAVIDDPMAWDFRRVSVSGTFLHDAEMLLTGRSHRGRAGALVVTPLRRSEPEAAGQIVLVDRGWVPVDRQLPESRSDSLAAGPVRVEGVARIPPARGWLRPDNRPEENLWFWIDLPAMAAYAGAPTVAPLVVEAGPGDAPEALPVAVQTAIDIPNNHLQYALTWFSLAAALLAIYILYHWRQSGRTPDEG